jgi:hypothetical protein
MTNPKINNDDCSPNSNLLKKLGILYPSLSEISLQELLDTIGRKDIIDYLNGDVNTTQAMLGILG